ncbi:hypothetical protein TWF718_006806 [Orbilia javanica]|uniref:Uncharacterized protein n=1 Tax=Orbilia javanica TaxID=47235 RepID=A0AAN8MNI4_9PEZI
MLPTLAGIVFFSISSLLFSGTLLNNHVAAFKISIDGREVEAGGFIGDLTLCNDINDGPPYFPRAIFAVQSPAVTCVQRGGLDNWVLEELEAFTSAHSYFAIRSYNGDYIIHRPIKSEAHDADRFFSMKSGAPGVNEEDGRTYVKSEFWLERNGRLQLINEDNPVRDGDSIVFAGPGPAEPHTRFHVMRSPHVRGLPLNDYRYQLLALLPGDDLTIPSDADILVHGMRIKLSGEFGEIVVGPLPPELLQQGQPKPQAKLQRRPEAPPAVVDFSLGRQRDNRGQTFDNGGTGGLPYNELPDELAWYPTPHSPGLDIGSSAPDLRLEDLRIQKSSGSRRSRETNSGSTLTDEAARLLGLPVSRSGSNKNSGPQTDEQIPGQSVFGSQFLSSSSNRRLPGTIGPPGSDIGAFNENNFLGGGQYYMRPSEVGPNGEELRFPPLAITKPNRMLGLDDLDELLRLDQPIDGFEDLRASIDDLGDLETYPIDVYDDDDREAEVADFTGLAGQIEDGRREIGDNQYYQPEEIYIDETEEPSFDTGNIADDLRGPAALDSGSLGGIPTSLFGQSSNSQDRNSPYPFGTSQSPPSGNIGRPLPESEMPLDQWREEPDPESLSPEEARPNWVNNNYAGTPLEKIEEEGSGESSARIDDPGSSQWGMQYEDDGSNWPSSPGIPWEDQIEEENEVVPGQNDSYDQALDGPDESMFEDPGSLEKRMQYEEDQTTPPVSPSLSWQEEYEEIIPQNNIELGQDEIYQGEADVQGELQAIPGDESWDSMDRSYDSLLLADWDNNGADRVSSSNIRGAMEMEDFLLPPPFDVGLPEDGAKKPRWWQRFRNKFTRKPKTTVKVREPTGFE